ncbi:MAG: hypothetical protein AAGI38_17940 [Bacteroidota bacterium]
MKTSIPSTGHRALSPKSFVNPSGELCRYDKQQRILQRLLLPLSNECLFGTFALLTVINLMLTYSYYLCGATPSSFKAGLCLLFCAISAGYFTLALATIVQATSDYLRKVVQVNF